MIAYSLDQIHANIIAYGSKCLFKNHNGVARKNMWTVYILECADGTYYTGITNDICQRIQAHSDGSGARYTRGRGPFTLKYTEECSSRSEATKREICIKKLTRADKTDLIKNHAKTVT